jgi:hypothetical protein
VVQRSDGVESRQGEPRRGYRRRLEVPDQPRRLRDPQRDPRRARGCALHHPHAFDGGSAVACKKEGLRYDNFYSAILHGHVAYHDFEGLTTDPSEQPRLVASLGTNPILILRNHGLLVVGADIPGAFTTYWTLQRACEIQAATDAMAGENLPLSAAVLQATPERNRMFKAGEKPGAMAFEGLLRRAGIRYDDLA